MKNWVIIIYTSHRKDDIYKVLNVDSIKQISYILQETTTDISNFYHKLIKPKNLLLYVDIIKR